MSGLFEGKPGKKIEMERMPQTEEQLAAIKYLRDMMGKTDYPLQEIAGLTPAELQGQDILSKLLGTTAMPQGYELGMGELAKTLGGAYRPETSPYYEGFRQQLQGVKEEGLADLARQSQKGGMLYSTGRTGAQAKYLGDIGAKQMSALGQLYEAERGRMAGAVPQALQYGQFEAGIPYSKLGAVSQYGGLPREIEQMRKTAAYQQKMMPFEKGIDISKILAGYSPYYMPQYTQARKSPWERYVSPLIQKGGDVATAAILAGA